MKRGTLEHPKLRRLARALDLEPWGAAGILESLWHWTARYARRGDVGRYTDEEIADGVGWQRRTAAELIAALVSAGWLDRCGVHRLVVHDVADHADQAWRKSLTRGPEGAGGFVGVSQNGTGETRDSATLEVPCPDSVRTPGRQCPDSVRTPSGRRIASRARARAADPPVPVPVPEPEPGGSGKRARTRVAKPMPPDGPGRLVGFLEATPFPDDLTLTADMRRRITEPPVSCLAPDAEFAAWRATMRAKRGRYSVDWPGLEWDAWIARHARFGCAAEAQLRVAGRAAVASHPGRVQQDDREARRVLRELVGPFDPKEGS